MGSLFCARIPATGRQNPYKRPICVAIINRRAAEPEPNPRITMIIPAEYIIAGFIAISGAVAALFRVLSKHNEATASRLKRTEELREDDNKEIRVLISEVSTLKGKQEGFKAGVERISSQVLQEVRSLQSRN